MAGEGEDYRDFELLDAIRKQYSANGVNVVESSVDAGTAATIPAEVEDESSEPLGEETFRREQALVAPTPPEETSNDKADDKGVSSNSTKNGEISNKSTKHGKDGAGTVVQSRSGDIGTPFVGVGIHFSSRMESLPGAFAEEGFEGDQPPRFVMRNENSNQQDIQTNAAVDDGVPVANIVRDEEQGQPSLDLPHAQSMDGNETHLGTSSETGTTRSDKPLIPSAIVMGCFALVVFALLLVAVLLVTWNKGKEQEPSEILQPPGTVPPLTLMEKRLMSLFPDYTLEALKDPESPQSQALIWLLEDPQLDTYIDLDWRVLQRFSLASFYYGNGGDHWDMNDRWLSYDHHECSWWARPWFAPPSPGMFFIDVKQPNPCECENVTAPILDEDARYKHLWLVKNNLQGSIPEEVFWLTSLRSISLSLNPLHGTLSKRFNLLSNLEAITLSRNDHGLTGTIPAELGELTKLSFLSLMGNRLTGNILVLGKLSQLRTVMLDVNKFTGVIPSELGLVTGLERLYLSKNYLTGTLPTEVGQLSALLHLFVYINNFSGMMPSELGLLKSLQRLSLRNNNFTGTLCTELGQLSSVLPIEVQNNQFTGPIPSQIGLLTNMTQLLAQNNQLTGTIPVEVRSLWPGSNRTVGSLLTLNVTENSFPDDLTPDTSCWVNHTFFEGELCVDYPVRFLAPSCSCKMCSCHVHNETDH